MKSIVKILFVGLLMLVAAVAINAGDVLFQDGGLNVSQDLRVSTNALYVNSASGLVGIGTTSPTAKLHVEGNTAILMGSDIRPTANSITALNIAQANGTDWVTFDTTNKRMYVGGTSNYGSHTETLNVYGVNGGNDVVMVMTDTTAQAAGIGGGIGFGNKYTDAGAYGLFSKIQGYKINGISGNYDSGISFYTTQNGGASFNVRAMNINQDGNVGIGTTSPNATLTIKVGGTTIADSWDVRSDRALKDQIAEVNVSTFDFSTAKLYSYKLKYSEINPETNLTEQKLTKARVGLMQDEIPVECRVGDAVDTYCLLALAYVKIAQLEAEVKALKAR